MGHPAAASPYPLIAGRDINSAPSVALRLDHLQTNSKAMPRQDIQ
jgi:hypothetical protein